MYVTCAEPHYRVHYRGLDVETDFGVRDKGDFWDHRPNTVQRDDWFHTERFSLTRRDEAVAMAQACHNLIVADDEPQPPEVHIPSSIATIDDRPVLQEAADYLMRAISRVGIPSLPPAVLRGILPVSELLWGKDIDDVDPELLAEAVDACRTALQIADPTMSICRLHDRQCLDEALRRWDDRPIAIPLVSESRGPRP